MSSPPPSVHPTAITCPTHGTEKAPHLGRKRPAIAWPPGQGWITTIQSCLGSPDATAAEEGPLMARAKPTLASLHELTPDQYADCFVQLVEKKHGTTREGKPFYPCRFSDARRTATSMVWADSPLFAACENEWQEGQFFKVRAIYGQHERYGPQLELEQIRPARDADREDGFDPAKLVEHSRFDPAALF